MYSLLIVDDEKQIREGLKQIINWEDYGITICAEASDGRDALEKIEKYHPLIVLTDIKMPVIDGLGVLETIKTKGIKTCPVVLSGYNDFSLVRQAMKFGAVDYLLKPAGKDELIQVIEEIIDQMSDIEDGTDESFRGLASARNSFLSRLVTSGVSAIEYRDKSELLDIDFGKQGLAAAKLELKEGCISDKLDTSQKVMLLQMCQEYLDNHEMGYGFFGSSGDCSIILKNIPKEEAGFVYRKELTELIELIAEKLGMDLYVSVSGVVSSYRRLPGIIDNITDTLEKRENDSETIVIYANEREILLEKSDYSKNIQEAVNAIRKDYSNAELSLQYLGDMLNVNTAYLGRQFKKEVGISFTDCLNWYRVEKAERLLKQTHIKGVELSKQVGFANYNYFYIVFKKLKGIKPTEVRGE